MVVVEPTGAEVQVVARLAGQEVIAVLRERLLFNPGETIHIAPEPGAAHLFDPESGNRL